MSLLVRRYQYNSSYFFDVAAGKIPGQVVGNSYGYIPDVDPSDGFISFWDEKSIVQFPVIAGPIYISSANAGDAGTFFGIALDADYVEHGVTATLNGQNAVQMLNIVPGQTNNFLWVNSALNSGVIASLGKIYISTTNILSSGKPVDASKILGIVYYDSAHLMSHEVMSNGAYVVPKNKTAYITAIRRFIGKNKDADINIEVSPYSDLIGIHTVPLVTAAFEIYEVNAEDSFSAPAALGSKTRVRFTARTDTNNTVLSTDLSFITIEN